MPVGGEIWHVDSAAGLCITGNRHLFSVFVASSTSPSIKFGDGVIQQAVGYGTIILCGTELRAPITLHNVLLVPNCPVNLLSVHALATSLDCSITFTSDLCIATSGSNVLWTIPSTDSGVYQFQSVSLPTKAVPAFACTPAVMLTTGVPHASREANLWHRRLGHPGLSAYQRLVSCEMLEGLPMTLSQVRTL